MKTTVIYHSADFDGIFCREIANQFLGTEGVQYIGWNFGDPPVQIPYPVDGSVYVMDLPLDKPFGLSKPTTHPSIVWIDHHKSSIESHPKDIPGYRIDGVAACRLAWQYFAATFGGERMNDARYLGWPQKQDFVDRKVTEPLAVRLAGEYDVWDKRHDWADLLQYGLRSCTPNWKRLLTLGKDSEDDNYVLELINAGETSRRYAQTVDAANMKSSFLRDWEGLKFLCLNGRGNSMTFTSRDVPDLGHDALMMFFFQGSKWVVSLYHAKHRTDFDLSAIATRYGGGGHKGACGFTCDKLPFL